MPFPVGKWSVQRIALGAGLPWDSALRYFWLQRPPLEARSPTHTAWCQWRVQPQKWKIHGIDKMILISIYKYIYILYIYWLMVLLFHPIWDDDPNWRNHSYVSGAQPAQPPAQWVLRARGYLEPLRKNTATAGAFMSESPTRFLALNSKMSF